MKLREHDFTCCICIAVSPPCDTEGYTKRAPTYEELLVTCSAIEEELLFAAAPSRLDYFKSGVQFEKRIKEKLVQLKTPPLGVAELTSTAQISGRSEKENLEEIQPIKRAKT
jgi:hypothetical protein